MIVEIPDKNLELEFPDDMDQTEISSIIQRDIYGVRQAPEASFGRLAKKSAYAARAGLGDMLSGFAVGAENAQRRQGEFGLGLREAVRRINPEAVSKERVPAFNADKAISGIISTASSMAMPPQYQEPTKSKAYNFIEDAVTGLAGSAPAMVATAVSPPAGIAMMYEQILGGGYNKRIQEGAEPDRAYIASALDAAAQAPIEYAGTVLELGALKKMAGGKAIKYLKTVLRTAAAEGLEEWLQAIPEKIADIYAANPDKSNRELAKIAIDELTSAKFAKEAGYQAAAGALGGGLLGAGGGAIQSIREAPGELTPPNIETVQDTEPQPLVQSIVNDLQSGQVTRADLESAIPDLEPEQAQAIQEALSLYQEPVKPRERGSRLTPPKIETVLPQPKSAEESAQVFEAAGQPRAEQAYDTFEQQGLLKTPQEKNQEIIEKTNIEAENEVEQNRFNKLQDFYEMAHEAGRLGNDMPSPRSRLVGKLTEQEKQELIDSYESGKHIQQVLTKAGVTEDEEDASRIFEGPEPSGQEIPQGRLEPGKGIEEGQEKRSDQLLVQAPSVSEQERITETKEPEDGLQKRKTEAEINLSAPPQAESKGQLGPSPAAPPQKEPWQMTRDEFGVPEEPKYPDYRPVPNIKKRFGAKGPTPEQEIEFKKELAEYNKEKRAYSKAHKLYLEKSNYHIFAVKRAIADGKIVPKDVLDEYPGLDRTPPTERRKQPIDMGGAPKIEQAPPVVNGAVMPERRISETEQKFKPGDTVKYGRGKYTLEEIENGRAIISRERGEKVVNESDLEQWTEIKRAPRKPKPKVTLANFKTTFKDQTGSSQIATDIINHGIELKNKGVKSFGRFRRDMQKRFRSVWDKIKGHMRSLWDVLNNERGQVDFYYGSSYDTGKITDAEALYEKQADEYYKQLDRDRNQYIDEYYSATGEAEIENKSYSIPEKDVDSIIKINLSDIKSWSDFHKKLPNIFFHGTSTYGKNDPFVVRNGVSGSLNFNPSNLGAGDIFLTRSYNEALSYAKHASKITGLKPKVVCIYVDLSGNYRKTGISNSIPDLKDNESGVIVENIGSGIDWVIPRSEKTVVIADNVFHISHFKKRPSSKTIAKKIIDNFVSKNIGKNLYNSLKNEKGSSELVNDIISFGSEQIQSGVSTLRQFRSVMRERFANVWDKIKAHMRSLWDTLNNQRGEVTIRQEDKTAQIKARYFKTGAPKPTEPPKVIKQKELSEKYSEKREVFERHFNDLMYWIVDKNRPFNTIQRKIGDVSDSLDVFLKETQRPKVTAARIKKVWDEQIKPMIEDMAKSDIQVQDLEEYKHAMHAPEANQALTESNAKRYLDNIIELIPAKETKAIRAEMKALLDERRAMVRDKKKQGITALKYEAGLLPKDNLRFLNKAFEKFGENEKVKNLKSKWDTFTEKPSGMTNADAENIIKKYKGDANIERIGKLLDDINSERLDILRDAGLITDDEYQAYKNKYDHYVPLYREGYDDSLFGPSSGLKPSGRPIKVRGGSTRNVVNIMANSISNLEKAINLAEKARSVKVLKELVSQNPDPDLWSLKQEKKSPRYDDYGNIRMYPDIFNVNDNQFRFMVDGKQYFLEVNRDNRDAMLMLKTLKAVDSMHGPIVSALSKINRHLARINTSLSPEFVISNFIRDFQTANINIKDTIVKGKSMFKGAKDAIKAIYAVERGKQKGTNLEKLYERFKASGGKIGWADVHSTVENLSNKLSKEIEMAQGKRPVRKVITQWGDLIEAANTSVENGIRLHAFKLAVEQGISDERAAQIASDLTVDFTKKGAAGPLINSLYLFANAGIQGSYRIIRAATKSRAVQKTLVGIMGAGFLAGLFNSLVGGEAADGEDYFNKIEDYIRERNAIFVIPGTGGKSVKIPLPWGYNLFWNIGSEFSMAFTKENYKPMEGAMRLASTFANAFNPIQSGTLLQTLAPTVIDPFVQVAENKNWFGGQLMPDQNKFDKTPTPDSQRYWKSRIGSVWVANQLNKLTGGDKIKSGALDVSPATLDLIIDTAGGSALRFFTDIGGLPISFIRGERPQMHKYPFIRRVFGVQSEWGDSRIYYSNLTEVLTAKEQLEAYRGTEYYQYLSKETKRQQAVFGLARASEKRLRKLRKAKKQIEASGGSNKEIDAQIKDIYIRFNKAYNEEREN